jgi:peptidoglycan/xylan/chitin deacetylase (PgdA/CDA1 family)/glycosyltransferase involved in cell wall biosynthesis
MYHRVSHETHDPWDLCVSPDNFAEQMAAIRSAGGGARLDQYAEPFRSCHPGSPRFALTFDDGYSDNIRSALPILERYEMPATLFVVSGALGSSREFWWDTLARCILAPTALPARLALDLGRGEETFALEETPRSCAAGSAVGNEWRAHQDVPSTPRQQLLLALWDRLVVMTEAFRQPVLDELISWAAVDPIPNPERLPLTAEDVARLAAHPLIEIGAHTVSHVSLIDLDPAAQHAEIVGSKLAIEKIIGKPVRFFSYPYGRRNDVTIDITRRAGFTIACTSDPAAATAFSRRHCLPRLQVTDDDGETFIRKVRQSVGFTAGQEAVPTVSRTSAVTVVMPFLNSEKYIEEAIESIIAQTDKDWELILVDDGSTDASTAIARDYAAGYPNKIRCVDHEGHENRGMSASRNLGVSLGSGEYVSFLDSDDVWLPARLEHFVAVARAFPQAGMIYGPTLYWYSWAKDRAVDPAVPRQQDFAGHLDLPALELIDPPAPLRQFLRSGGGCLPGTCSLLVRRDAYDRVGGFEPNFRGLYEDQVFLSKMVLCHSVVTTGQVLDRYRQHLESCCYRAMETGEYHPMNLHPARLRYLRWLERYCRDRGIDDPVIQHALREQIGRYPYPRLYASKLVRGVVRRLRRHLPASTYDRLKSRYVRLEDKAGN